MTEYEKQLQRVDRHLDAIDARVGRIEHLLTEIEKTLVPIQTLDTLHVVKAFDLQLDEDTMKKMAKVLDDVQATFS